MHKRICKTVTLWSILDLFFLAIAINFGSNKVLQKFFIDLDDSYIHGPISFKVCSDVGAILKFMSDNWHLGKSKIMLRKFFFLILIHFTPYLRFVCTSPGAFRLRVQAVTSGNFLNLAWSLHFQVRNRGSTILLSPLVGVGIRKGKYEVSSTLTGLQSWLNKQNF